MMNDCYFSFVERCFIILPRQRLYYYVVITVLFYLADK